MKIKSFGSLTALLVLIANGCGYTNQLVLPRGGTSIAVPVFENEIQIRKTYTYTSGLEMDVTQKIIDEMISEASLKVVDEDEADLVLNGAILAYEQEPLRFNALEGVEEYRLFITVRLELKDRRNGESIWLEPDFTGQTTYFISGALAISERDAAILAMKDLADKVVNRIVEDW